MIIATTIAWIQKKEKADYDDPMFKQMINEVTAYLSLKVAELKKSL